MLAHPCNPHVTPDCGQLLQGVCFGVIKRKMSSTRGSVGRGHGFVMLKQLEVKQATKVQHARTSSIYQMPKCWWTAPAWVNFDIGNLTPDFGGAPFSKRVLFCLPNCARFAFTAFKGTYMHEPSGAGRQYSHRALYH